MKRTIPILLIACFLPFVFGCDSPSDDSDAQGRIRVLLTDAPADDMREANVIIRRVELRDSTASIVVLNDVPLSYNLLNLQDSLTAIIADTLIPVGTYRQARIVLDDEALVVWKNGERSELKIPSGSTSGTKVVNLNVAIEDEGDLLTTITFDFDVEDSFVVTSDSNEVIFKPVIRLQEVENARDGEMDHDLDLLEGKHIADSLKTSDDMDSSDAMQGNKEGHNDQADSTSSGKNG